jgi:hypothetical protein
VRTHQDDVRSLNEQGSEILAASLGNAAEDSRGDWTGKSPDGPTGQISRRVRPVRDVIAAISVNPGVPTRRSNELRRSLLTKTDIAVATVDVCFAG